jgi:hypothetical protein
LIASRRVASRRVRARATVGSTATGILLITSDAFSQAVDVDPDANALYERFLELFVFAISSAKPGRDDAPGGYGNA